MTNSFEGPIFTGCFKKEAFMRYVFITSVFLLLVFAAGFTQQLLVLQPGPVDGKDTYVNSAYPDRNWGTNPNMIPSAWTYDGVFGAGRALIRFDLSQIPPGTQVLDARLTLFYDPEAGFGEQYGENASSLQRITEDWNEMTVTWNNQPSATPAGAVYLPKTNSTSEDLVDIDITGFVAGWVLHPETNFGFMHSMVTEITYCCITYSSSDHVNTVKHPKLVITYRKCDRPVAGFTFTTQIPSVAFSDTSSAATTWFWSFGDGYFSNLQNPQHTYAMQGIYTVCLAASDSCGSDTVCKELHVCKSPEPHFNYSADGNMVAFRDSSTTPQSWFWDFGDGFYSDLNNPQHYFNYSGSYLVCEKVTNGCNEQTFCDSVIIIANAIKDQAGNFGVTIYPNPLHDVAILQLNVQTRSDVIFELFTPQNRGIKSWVRKVNPGDPPISLNLAGLPGGIYFLRTKIDGNIRLNKLIIQ